MVDFYQILGCNPDASADEIKRAYQKAAFAHHPDLNPGDAKASQQRFREITEAYQVLRDKSKRQQYDLMRRAGFTSAEDFDAGLDAAGRSPFGEPGAAEDFERTFGEWWKRMGEEFRDYAEERAEQERMTAERVARAAAWEREKEEAKLNKARAERLRQRTEDARHLRHARVLRRFWQTRAGLTPADAGLAALVVGGAAGLAWAWKLHLAQGAARQAGAAGQPQQQPATAAAAAAT